jgi:hypothetical protein
MLVMIHYDNTAVPDHCLQQDPKPFVQPYLPHISWTYIHGTFVLRTQDSYRVAIYCY